jgi:hypothetical protein
MCWLVPLFRLNRFCICDLKTLPFQFQRGAVLCQQVWRLGWWCWRVQTSTICSEPTFESCCWLTQISCVLTSYLLSQVINGGRWSDGQVVMHSLPRAAETRIALSGLHQLCTLTHLCVCVCPQWLPSVLDV